MSDIRHLKPVLATSLAAMLLASCASSPPPITETVDVEPAPIVAAPPAPEPDPGPAPRSSPSAPVSQSQIDLPPTEETLD